MKTIVLDTNFIIAALEFRIDIRTELSRILDFNFEIATLSSTSLELEKLIKEGEYFERKQAMLAMAFLKKAGFKALPAEGNTDELLLRLDKANDIIATQDLELRKRLKAKGFKTVVIRQKKHFKME